MSEHPSAAKVAPSKQLSPLVVLVGPPGAGKTTVGRLLADRGGVAFRDTDEDVEQAAGMPVSDIFIEHGEAKFREMERDAVRRALADHVGVLALGGGAVVDDDTRSALVDQQVVFLDVSLPAAAGRIGLNRDRPLLIGNPRSQLRTMLEQRRPLYVEVASVTVETDGKTPEDVAAAIESAL